MNSLIYLLTKGKFLLVLLGLGILLLILSPLYLPGPSEPVPSPSPSPATLRGLPEFPQAQPQEFDLQSSLNQGSLAVNAKTEGVKVTIDAQEVKSPEFFAPDNITPFIVERIPVGRHVLRASKLGFLSQTFPVDVKPDQVTQVNIEMKPDPDFDALEEAASQMPISTDEYFIEYLDKIGKIQVIVRKAPFETYKQSAINWFKQRGIENPEESGVLFYPAVNIY